MRRFSFFLVSAATVAVLAAIGEPAISEAAPGDQTFANLKRARAALRVTLPREAGVYHVRVGKVDPSILPTDKSAPEALRLGDAYYTGSAWDLRARLIGEHESADALFLHGDVHVMYWKLNVHNGDPYRLCDCVRYWEQRVMDHLGNRPTNPRTYNRVRAVSLAEMDALTDDCEKMRLENVQLAYPPRPPGKLTLSETSPITTPYVRTGAQAPTRTLQGNLPVPLRTALQQRLPDSPGVYRLIDIWNSPAYSYVGSAHSVRDRLLYQQHPTAHLLLRQQCVGVTVAPIDLTRARVPPNRMGRICSCLTWAEQYWMDKWEGKNARLTPRDAPLELEGPARMLNEERPMSASRVKELKYTCENVVSGYQVVWPTAQEKNQPPCGPGGNKTTTSPPAGPGPGGGPPDDHVTTCKQKGQPCEDDTQCCEDGATDKPFVGANSWKAVCVPDSAGAKVCVKPTCVPRDKPCNRGDEVNQLQYQGRSCCYDGATEMPVQGGQYAYTCHYISSDNLNGTCKQ